MAGTYQFYVTNSNSYSFLREIPIIVIGVNGSGAIAGTSAPQPLLSAQIEIASGQNYTSYLIGNTWSDMGLRLLTVED